jgi:hypothetical protein
MNIVFSFLVEYETWIYVLAAIATIILFRNLVLGWRELQSTLFGLERETAKRKFNSNLSGLILTGLIVTTEFIVVSVVSIKYPSMVVLVTPTLEFRVTSTPEMVSIPGISGTNEEPGRGTGSIEGCNKGKIEWIAPLSGETIKGKVELKGTVNVTDLGFYKYEFKSANDPSWTTIAGGSMPVIEGALGGLWQTENLTPGEYLLRLVVLDNRNDPFPPCIIPVTIKAP